MGSRNAKRIQFRTRFPRQQVKPGRNIRLDYAMHTMQGKTYLRKELSKLGNLILTTGGDTANKRIDWGIEKSHSNDAVVITDLQVIDINIFSFTIKPMRRQTKSKITELKGFKHRDIVRYTKKNGETYEGHITALFPEKNQFSMAAFNGRPLKRYSIDRLQLLWRFNKIFWL